MRSSRPSWRSTLLGWAGVLALAASLLPPLLVLRTWLPVAEDLDVPYWDQWEMVPLLDAARAGTLGPADFWAQDVEARPVLPRLILVALALATGWDTRAEVALNLAVSAAAVAVLIALLYLTVRPWSPGLVPWLALATSAVAFTLARHEAWVWGPSLATVTSATAACVAAFAIGWPGSSTASPGRTGGRRSAGPWIAMAAAVIATFSFTNGLLLLILVPLALLVDLRHATEDEPRAVMKHSGDGAGRRADRRAAIVAGGLAAATAATYFAGFAPGLSATSGGLPNPARVAGFLLVYLGSPFGALSPVGSGMAGATGLAVGAGAGAWLWWYCPERRTSVLPWLFLGVFGLLCGVMAALGRSRFGADHALASRYQTFSGLFWIAVIVLTALAVREILAAAPRGHAVPVTTPRPLAVAVAALVAAAVCLGTVSYVQTWIAAAEPLHFRVEALRRGRECVTFHPLAPRECLALIYPDPEIARRHAQRLEALALGPFRPSAASPPLAAYRVSDERRTAGSVDAVHMVPALLVNPVSAVYQAREVVVLGWAIDPAARRPARSILVVVDGQIAGRTRPDSPRPDVVTTLGDERMRRSGWTFRFGAFRLAPGPHSIEGYAMLGDGGIVRLARGWSITVAPPSQAPASSPRR